MKQKFSTMWRKSIQTRKQREYRVNAPLNIRQKMTSSNLSKDLRKKYGKRSFMLRKGDEVKVMNGKEKGKKGKVSLIKLDKMKIAIEGIQRKKKDGSKVNILFDSSNVQIQELNLNDKMRLEALNRKEKTENQTKTGDKKNV